MSNAAVLASAWMVLIRDSTDNIRLFQFLIIHIPQHELILRFVNYFRTLKDLFQFVYNCGACIELMWNIPIFRWCRPAGVRISAAFSLRFRVRVNVDINHRV